jgi:glutamyl-tRNA synthetase
MIGRFAPSPTGRLHLGNLRTAMVAWLFARSTGSRFLVRMEDLDPVTSRREFGAEQLADLATIGLDWDGEVVWQSERSSLYAAIVERLVQADLTYPCYCTRKEVLAAAQAPNGDSGNALYSGACRQLTVAERAQHEESGRRPALRLRTNGERVSFTDALCGPVDGLADDLVLVRNDGGYAYNLAVVVDDVTQGVEQVVRADDLLSSTARQMHLARLLDFPDMTYAHVPLVLGPAGDRLAKRDGAVTLADLAPAGVEAPDVRARLAASLGLAEHGEPVSMALLLDRFDPARLPREPWTWRADAW